MTARSKVGAWALPAVLVAAALYVWPHLDHGWIPHDEGALAHPAERVLGGEVPHRDFADAYTGGLSYYNAVAMRVLGARLMSLRYALFLVFLAWIPATWYVARKFVGVWGAAIVTAIAVMSTLPNYPAAMPSWYNLFLAGFALFGLVRWLETGRSRWLVFAGAAVGVSVLVKIVGLYLLAGVLVGLTLVDQEHTSAAEGRSSSGDRTWALVITGAAALLLLLVMNLVGTGAGLREMYHYVLPAASVVALVIAREWLRPPEPWAERTRRLVGSFLPLLAGFSVPVLGYLLIYVWAGGLEDLLVGVFVAPRRRLVSAAVRPPPITMVPYACGVLGLLLVGRFLGRRWRWGLAGLLGAAGLAVLLTPGVPHYFAVLFSLQGLGPVLALTGLVLFARPVARDSDSESSAFRRRAALVLLAPLGLAGLIQFPFAIPVYFFYFAPLVLLAAVAVVAQSTTGPRPVLAVVGGLVIVFLGLQVNGGSSLDMMLRPARDMETARLELDRARLRVHPGHKATWERVTALLREHAPTGPVYAGPDAPEFYFLTGRPNPTRSLFDFLDEPEGRTALVLAALDRAGVDAVAINEGPSFSGPMHQDLRTALEERYPNHEQVQHFQVRWRE